jgi:hypothetical protein
MTTTVPGQDLDKIAATIHASYTVESEAGASPELDDRHAFACRYAASIVANLAHSLSKSLNLSESERRTFVASCYDGR